MFLMADLSLPVSRGDDNLLFFPDSQLVDPESWELRANNRNYNLAGSTAPTDDPALIVNQQVISAIYRFQSEIKCN